MAFCRREVVDGDPARGNARHQLGARCMGGRAVLNGKAWTPATRGQCYSWAVPLVGSAHVL